MTIFAVMVAFGAVMGMLALSVDVGNVMYERRQLQNGADASAMALARECANDVALCEPDNPEVESLLDQNANDGSAQYDSRGDATAGACGRATGAPLPACTSASSDAPITDLKECPPLPNWLSTGEGAGIPYVETYTRTDSGGGNTVLPKWFSQLVVGGGADASVTACARAAWGPVGSYTGSVPIVISACEWQDQTAGGTDYVTEQPIGPAPGYGGGGQPAWPDGSREVVVILHDPGDESSDCDWNGHDNAGGFGFVDGADCSAAVSTDGWVQIDTGASAPSPCRTVLPGLVGTAISLPVFDCLIASHSMPTGSPPTTPPGICDPTTRESGGANSWYHVQGWARFYLSGYRFPGMTEGSVHPSGHSACGGGGGTKCLFGWFLKGSLDASTIDPGGPDFGSYVILPAG